MFRQVNMLLLCRCRYDDDGSIRRCYALLMPPRRMPIAVDAFHAVRRCLRDDVFDVARRRLFAWRDI